MPEASNVWVIDDDHSIRWVLEKALTRAGLEVRLFDSAAGALEPFTGASPDVILTDIRMPGEDGLDLLGPAPPRDHYDCPFRIGKCSKRLSAGRF